ncbi:MAG: phosphatase PAP2 family protein [bacterium]|nr:phosphatase PAP2 family protein [bacterium]
MIQTFVEKARPDVVLQLFVENRDALVLQNLPANTFPSDHLAMASAIATVTLVWGLKHKDKTFILLSLPLILFAIIMGFGRITIGVHWPTDILVGTIVGVLVGLLVFEKHILAFLKKFVFRWIKDFQEWIWEKLFGERR